MDTKKWSKAIIVREYFSEKYLVYPHKVQDIKVKDLEKSFSYLEFFRTWL